MTNEMLISVIQVIFLLCIRCNIADKNVVFPLKDILLQQNFSVSDITTFSVLSFSSHCVLSVRFVVKITAWRNDSSETLKVIPVL